MNDIWTHRKEVERVSEEHSDFIVTAVTTAAAVLANRYKAAKGGAMSKEDYQQYQEQQRQEGIFNILAQKSASEDRAYEIRSQLKKAERSSKIKSGLIIGGILLTTIAVGGLIAYKIIKNK